MTVIELCREGVTPTYTPNLMLESEYIRTFKEGRIVGSIT